jgi:hypothetical protein
MIAIFFRFIIAVPVIIAATTSITWSAPACPLSYGTTDSVKSHKLYLYFPTANDPAFPGHPNPSINNYSPARPFNVASLNPAIGSTLALRNRIYDVVADDYCEFNVQVLSTTTNPETLPASPPARRVIVAIGSDDPLGDEWGLAHEVDIGDNINIDYARVWAGTYKTCEGWAGGNCSTPGALTGANATLDRWAQAIGGSAAHEAGHTYGLQHTDDNPPNLVAEPGPTPLPGEDDFTRHLMPSGRLLSGEHRAGFRRHISDRTYGLLATNVGLSVQTMHNWDMLNPNAAEAHSLRIDFLSTQTAVNVTWSWTGSSSPWINPIVSRQSGTTSFKGILYNRYRITWSAGNPAWTNPQPGVLPGGAKFHIGATFTGVDFNQPDPIVIQNVTLLGAGANPLTLHPRLPMYNSGTFKIADGTFTLNFFAVPGGTPLIMQGAAIYQLPRVASIESLTGEGLPFTYDKTPIRPWSTSKCDGTSLLKTVRCVIAKVSDEPHVTVTHKIGEKGVYDCTKGVPTVNPPDYTKSQDSVKLHSYANSLDSVNSPDYEGPICAGTTRDPFPSTTIYVIATFIDPKAKYYDPEKKAYVIGPVTSKVYYQFAGVRDLSKIGKAQVTVKDDRDPTQYGENVMFTTTVAQTVATEGGGRLAKCSSYSTVER